MSEKSIFSKIVEGEIPCEHVAESENFLAFLDIAPVSQGHTLIIPKEEFKDFHEFPQKLAQEWVLFTQEVMGLLTKKLSCNGINIGMNNGSAAGQVVFHQHTHIIPRYEGDGLEHWPNKEVSPEELAELAKKIRE